MTETEQATEQGQDYERSIEVARPVEEVFAYVSEVANLPSYLPPIQHAERREARVGNEQDAAQAGAEGVHLTGELKGQSFENDGWFKVDPAQHRLQWGAQLEATYSGELTVTSAGGDAGSEVWVRLSFGPRSPHDEMQERTGEDRDLVQEALGASLESIRRQLEGEGGKVMPPEPPGPPPGQ